jgi:hypothetical protein
MLGEKQPSFGKACYKILAFAFVPPLAAPVSNGEIGESRLEDLARRSLSFREARPKLPA